MSALRFSLFSPPLPAKVAETKEEGLVFYKPHSETGEMILSLAEQQLGLDPVIVFSGLIKLGS